jgi:hypothetical protein
MVTKVLRAIENDNAEFRKKLLESEFYCEATMGAYFVTTRECSNEFLRGTTRREIKH